MTLSIWEVFRTLFHWGGKPDGESDEGGDEGRVIPSPLDLSVRIAHGGPDDDIVRELSKINERARELKDSRRGN